MAYHYDDSVRPDILRMVPEDGRVIGSVGCGRGATEGELVRQNREVHGVDVSAEAIEVAKSRLTTARAIRPNDWDCFEADSLDGLIFADVLEHIPQAWVALEHFARALRPGGWAVISVPNMRSLKVLTQFMLRGDWPEHETGIYDRTHVQMMSKRRLERWLLGAGLEPERWFENYLCLGAKQKLVKALDVATLRLGHEWFVFQLQVRARKRARA